jgi:DNA repair protein RadC
MKQTQSIYKATPSYRVKDNALIITTNKEREYILTIHDLPSEDKPRQKLITLGPTSLKTSELLAVILNTGTKKEGVLSMSERIIKEYGENNILSMTDPQRVAHDFDIPLIKACTIVAAGELGRRYFKRKEVGRATLRVAKDVFEYAKDMRDLPKEHLKGIYLDSHNRVIHDEMISIGTINTNIVHPREVFRAAIEYNAAAVILVHNHPSGIVTPSDSDIKITKQLIEAGKIMGINLLDHIIVTKDSFLSIEVEY